MPRTHFMKYQEIIESLSREYTKNLYQLQQCYVFAADWESDWLHMTRSGYFHEIEIKLTRSDFRADFKKESKHRILSSYKKHTIIIPRGRSAEYIPTKNEDTGKPDYITAPYTRIDIAEFSKIRCPNKFYYCAVDGVIPISEVTEYAGLLTFHPQGKGIRYRMQVSKEAPFLHKTKMDLTNVLLTKFYYRTLMLERKDYLRSHEMENLKQRYDNLKKSIGGTTADVR